MNAKSCKIAVALLFLSGMMFSPSYADENLSEKIERLEQRIERLEKELDSLRNAETPPMTPASQHEAVTEQIIKEEMGSVEGVILWKGKPLRQGRVKIVLTKYTGFSLGSLKRMFKGERGKSSDQEVALVTQTDSQGRYLFEKVPPGRYRLYWLPDKETGWIRRLREKPDFEVAAGKRTLQDIPGKKE